MHMDLFFSCVKSKATTNQIHQVGVILKCVRGCFCCFVVVVFCFCFCFFFWGVGEGGGLCDLFWVFFGQKCYLL